MFWTCLLLELICWIVNFWRIFLHNLKKIIWDWRRFFWALWSIAVTTLLTTHTYYLLPDSDNRCTVMGGSRPMTPRRVKRRNVNSKSSHPLTYQPRQDQQPPPYFRKSSAYGSARSSGRSSTRRQRATTHNPISKYLEQQHQYSFQQRSEYLLSNFYLVFWLGNWTSLLFSQYWMSPLRRMILIDHHSRRHSRSYFLQPN